MTKSSKRIRTPAYPPISEEGYRALCKYLDQAVAYWADPSRQPPCPKLLRVGLPQGSIKHITEELGLQVQDTGQEGMLRTARLFDPEAIVLVRLLLAAGGSIGLNRKNMNRRDRLDYPHLRWCIGGVDWKVPLLRVIADTQPGRQTPAATDHYSLRRADIPRHETHRSSYDLTLEGLPTKTPYLGRDDAIICAMRLLRKKAYRLGFKLTTNELRHRILQAIELLDRRPLKAA